MKTEFDCAECKRHIVYEVPPEGGAVGYGEYTGKPGKVCYPCCGKLDREEMVRTGRAWLYVSNSHVTNWPNSLRFPVVKSSKGSHNMARERLDVWFKGPDEAIWHGVTIGDNDICRCRRTKRTRL